MQFLKRPIKRLIPPYFFLIYNIIAEKIVKFGVLPLCSIYNNSNHVVWCTAIINTTLGDTMTILLVISGNFLSGSSFQIKLN